MKPALLAFFLALAAMAGCDSAESRRMEETRATLAGTWLREAGADENSRRVLELAADGKFTDRVRVVTADGSSRRQEFAGEWSYDGIHLKRRYLRENGRQYSGGSMRYATFPLLSVAPSEFVVDDNIAGRKVSYRRVPEGTQP